MRYFDNVFVSSLNIQINTAGCFVISYASQSITVGGKLHVWFETHILRFYIYRFFKYILHTVGQALVKEIIDSTEKNLYSQLPQKLYHILYNCTKMLFKHFTFQKLYLIWIVLLVFLVKFFKTTYWSFSQLCCVCIQYLHNHSLSIYNHNHILCLSYDKMQLQHFYWHNSTRSYCQMFLPKKLI